MSEMQKDRHRGRTAERDPSAVGAHRPWWLGVLVILATACGSPQPPTTEGPVSQYLAALRRLSVLEGTGRAVFPDSVVRYLAGALEEIGTVPGAKSSEGRTTYTQWVPPLEDGGGHSVLEVRSAKGTARIGESDRTFLLVAPGREGPAPPPRSPVFVGRALHVPEYGVDDLGGLDLAGRPVLMMATPPDSAALAPLPTPVRAVYADRLSAQHRRLDDLMEGGASAVFLIPDRWLPGDWEALRAMRRRLLWDPVEASPGHAGASPVPIALLHVDLVDRLFLGSPYHPISHVGEYRSFELEGVAIGIHVDARREPGGTANVLGLVPGSDPSVRNEYVLVTGLLDTRAGGRGDDEELASCALLLAAADAIAAARLRRPVLFAFLFADGEGAPAAVHLLSHLPVPREAVVASIHVDGLAGTDSPSLGMEAMASHPKLAKAVQRALPRATGVVDAASAVALFGETPAGVFARAAIPSVLLEIRMKGAEVGPPASDGLSGLADVLRAIVAGVADARSLPPIPRAGARAEAPH